MKKIRRVVLYVLPILLLGIFGQKEARAEETENPYIISIEPSSGAPGMTLTIHGRNFSKIVVIQYVKFGSNTAETLDWKDDKIVVRVPPGKETVEVRAAGPTGRSNPVSFTYMEPIIESISPSSDQPGSGATIKGKYFGFKEIHPSFYVKFGKSLATVKPNSWTDEQIIVEAPGDYGTGISDAKMMLNLVTFAYYGWIGAVDKAIEKILTDLLRHGVKIPPGESKIEVDVRVTTPVGKSNAVVFTYQVPKGREAPVPIVKDWKEYKLGVLSFSLPADWTIFDMPTAVKLASQHQYLDPDDRAKIAKSEGYCGYSIEDYLSKKHINFSAVVAEAKDTESGKTRIVYYGMNGGKKIVQPGTTAQTISLGYPGYLVDGIETKIAGFPVTVCVFHLTEKDGLLPKGFYPEGTKIPKMNFSLFRDGRHYYFDLTGVDSDYLKAICKEIIERIRLSPRKD